MKYLAFPNNYNISIFFIDVLNELTGALEIRNEQKKANEAQSQSVHDAARHENSSDLSTMVENPIDDENGMYTYLNCFQILCKKNIVQNHDHHTHFDFT